MNYMSVRMPLILGYNVYENLRYVPEDLNVNDLKYIQDEDGGRYRPQTTSTPLGPTSNRLDNPSMDFLVAGSTDFFEEDDIYQVCGGGVADPHSIEYQQDLGCFNDFRSLSYKLYVLWYIMERGSFGCL